MTVADDAQLAAHLQATLGIAEHLPGGMIGDRMLLVERWVAQYRLHAFTLNPRQRVIHFKLTAIQILRQVVFHV
ncbi:hypothetical protein D3C79_849580 [compost metagenome]